MSDLHSENFDSLIVIKPVEYDEPEGLDTTGVDEWIHYPLDSILVRQEPRTVADVVRRINNDRYIMDPDFQRDFIWNEIKQCRLIESSLMRIPLPVFYLAEQNDGRIVVVDGLQRLTTFKRFLNNEFPLRNLEMQSLNGKRFQDLEAKHQNRVEDTNLILYLIDAKVPEKVKLDIFDRVNSGEPLTRQQMRNCIYVGHASRWLKEEAKTTDFLQATGRSLNPKTMRDREVINRFCGFTILGIDAYKGDMDVFLAETLRTMNTMSNKDRTALSDSFRRSMINNYNVFGSHAFRKHTRPDDRRSVINVALFDAFSTLFALYDVDEIAEKAHNISEGFYQLMQDTTMIEAISLGTNQVSRVRTRFHLIEQMMVMVLNHA